MEYQNITHMLKTVFVSDFSLSEDMAINIYKESLSTSGKTDEMKKELSAAFNDESISWKKMLCNNEYEVLDFDSEEEAKSYVKKILWDPIM